MKTEQEIRDYLADLKFALSDQPDADERARAAASGAYTFGKWVIGEVPPDIDGRMVAFFDDIRADRVAGELQS